MHVVYVRTPKMQANVMAIPLHYGAVENSSHLPRISEETFKKGGQLPAF